MWTAVADSACSSGIHSFERLLEPLRELGVRESVENFHVPLSSDPQEDYTIVAERDAFGRLTGPLRSVKIPLNHEAARVVGAYLSLVDVNHGATLYCKMRIALIVHFIFCTTPNTRRMLLVYTVLLVFLDSPQLPH